MKNTNSWCLYVFSRLDYFNLIQYKGDYTGYRGKETEERKGWIQMKERNKILGFSVLNSNQIIFQLTTVICRWTPTFNTFCNGAKKKGSKARVRAQA